MKETEDMRLRIGVEVILEEAPITPLISQLILLTKLRDQDPKIFDIAVKALQESEQHYA